MYDRVYNFSPGPSALPESVLERARDELLNFRGHGMSIMEISHRNEIFVDVVHHAREGLRSLLNIPEDFEILFLQGGATLQFYMIPLNLLIPGKPVDIIHTGHWSMKAINELHKFGDFNVVASSEEEGFTIIPHLKREDFNPEASYVYLVSNNTIYGTQWFEYPDTGGVPLVIDMTSDILTRPLDFSNLGVVFASAQKNMGMAGVTVVIIRKDLAERCSHDVGTILQYRTHIKSHTLYNTPPSYSIYMISLMVDWFKEEGGVPEFEKRSKKKSQLLYDIIDEDDFYTNKVRRQDRSRMNVVFRIKEGDEKLEDLFVQKAKEGGFVGVKGHRIAGGLRISLYNGVPIEAAEALAAFMKGFRKKYQK